MLNLSGKRTPISQTSEKPFSAQGASPNSVWGESHRLITEGTRRISRVPSIFIQEHFTYRRYKMNVPTNLKYAKSDEWIKVEGNIASIGVTDYAQSQLSDIVYFEFKVDPGESVEKNSTIATLESVKAAADVNTPVSGNVSEINENLIDEFESINADPYGAAWMLKIELADPSELDNLMDAAAYEKYCEERSH
jgi:glycine cleavage system H protein